MEFTELVPCEVVFLGLFVNGSTWIRHITSHTHLPTLSATWIVRIFFIAHEWFNNFPEGFERWCGG